MTKSELIETIVKMANVAYEKMNEPYLDLRYYQGRYHAFIEVLRLLKGE